MTTEWLIEHGDCLEVMRSLGDGVIDSIVTDPPYGVEASSGEMLGQVAVGKERRGGFAYGGAHTRGYAEHDPVAFQKWFTEISREMLRVLKPGGHLLAFGGARAYHRMSVAIEDAGFEVRDSIAWVRAQGMPKGKNLPGGWGTTLRTVQEPIVVARKPFAGPVGANVAKHGTGAMNIDGTRVEGGRWPTNLVLTHAEECAETCVPGCPVSEMGAEAGSIFFPAFRYCSKARKADRGEGNTHPTPKPVALMEWIVRLVTPVGGIVLDPFAGSGTTGVATVNQGFDFIGIEKEAEWVRIARARLETA
jgi:site-specific DNA-methyltransferase (adenine-specific)